MLPHTGGDAALNTTMNIEEHEWQKRLVVLRPVPGLLTPGSICVSKASSGEYCHIGQRRTEKNRAVFQYTLSGCGIFEAEGQQYALTPGKGFCCYVSDERIAYQYPEGKSAPWRFLYVTFIDESGATRILNDHFGFVFSIDPAEAQIKQLLSYRQNPKMTIEMGTGAAHLFVNSIIAMLADQAQIDNRRPNASLHLVRQAMRVIEENLRTPFNASQLADELHVSQEHLNRVCRAELGRTPYQCITQNKIQWACEQLRNTGRPVSEIASELGYDPGSHFARLFKRIMGVTPSSFRKNASTPLKPFH